MHRYSKTLFNTPDDIREWVSNLVRDSVIQAPFVSAIATRDEKVGEPVVAITASLDPKETWGGGWIHNSRFARIYIYGDGSMVHNAGSNMPKFRKTKAVSLDDAVSKINHYVNANR